MPKKRQPKKLTNKQRASYREAAKRQYHDEGRIEIDDEAPVTWVAPEEGGHGGAYVQAWVWVDDED
jgi:hypothetical protein